MAGLHRRPDLCRRHTRPPRSQRPSHRSRRRQPQTQAAQIKPKGLTADPQLAKDFASRGPPDSRHHLRSPGDMISGSVGHFVGISTSKSCDARRRDASDAKPHENRSSRPGSDFPHPIPGLSQAASRVWAASNTTPSQFYFRIAGHNTRGRRDRSQPGNGPESLGIFAWR
jgi:hypothetical protein